MGPRVLVDTGPLYALSDRDDQFHARASSQYLLLKQARTTLFASWPTICEAHALVARRLGYPFALCWLHQASAGLVIVEPLREDLDYARELLEKFQDQTIVLHDALVAAIARRTEIAVWTFDRHFVTMGVRLWPDEN